MLLLVLGETTVNSSGFWSSADVLSEVLQQEQMQQLTFKDLSSLLETCLLGCPDRARAISLVRVIRSTLLPNTESGMAGNGTSMFPVDSSGKATEYAQVRTYS